MQVKQVKDPVRLGLERLRRHLEAVSDHRKIFASRKEIVEGRVLREVPYVLSRLTRTRRLTKDRGVTVCGPDLTDDDLDRGAFPGTIRAKKTINFPWRN